MQNLYPLVQTALCETNPIKKAALTLDIYAQFVSGSLKIDQSETVVDIPIAGRPEKPILVAVNQVEKRKLTTPEGYAAMLHAICHIEFNAINLALDAAYRFRTLNNLLPIGCVSQKKKPNILRSCVHDYWHIILIMVIFLRMGICGTWHTKPPLTHFYAWHLCHVYLRHVD